MRATADVVNALVVCRTFLILTGRDLEASQDEKYTVIMVREAMCKAAQPFKMP